MAPSTPAKHPNHASDEVFRSLADPTRRNILQLLLAMDLNVSQLVSVLRQPQSTISRHLKVLRDCGLVRDRRAGTTVFYQAASHPAAEGDVRDVLLGWLRAQPLSRALKDRLDRTLRGHHDESVAFFERLGKKWDELRTAAFGEAFATEAFVTLLPREWTVADIGTGTGHLLPILAEHFDRVMAVEPATAMLECARQRVPERHAKKVEFHQGDLGALPLSDAGCDLAIACLVLHHVHDPAAALSEMRRILKPDGRLLIIEQHAHENQRFYDDMQDLWWGFEPEDLAARVTAAGLDVVSHRDLIMPTVSPKEMDAPRLFVLTSRRSRKTTRAG